MKILPTLVVGLLLTGCAAMRLARPEGIAGFYESTKGGFNESLYLELKQDDAYELNHMFIGDVISADGSLNSWGGKDTGTWSVEAGVLTLKPEKIGTDRSPMFLPAYCDHFQVNKVAGSVLLTSVATPAIPAASPAKIVLRRTGQLPAWIGRL